MTPLDHASAHELLADLALEPGSLARFGADERGAALAAHLAVCADCRREAEASKRTEAAILSAAEGAGGLAALADDRPISAPASLRAAIAAIPRSTSGSHRAGVEARRPTVSVIGERDEQATRRTRRTLAGPRAYAVVGLAAVVVAGVALGAFAFDAGGRASSAVAERESLQALIVDVERILAAPDHTTVALRTADGAPAGTVAWTDSEIAVVATGLPAPTAGATYRCWIERGGVRTAIGEMTLVGSTASWTGSVDAWGTVSLSGGGRFGVSMEPAAGGVTGPAILVADLSS